MLVRRGDAGIDRRKLVNLLAAMRLNYSADIPYHCAAHAADVLASIHFFLHGGVTKFLTPLDIFTLFIAALGHDLNLFSLNNNFLYAP